MNMTGERKFGAATCKVGPSVQIPKRMRDRIVEMSGLFCPPEQRGQGFATELVHSVCREADDANYVVLIHVQPYGEIGMSEAQLAEWYARTFGFAPIQVKPLLMARMPGSTPRLLTPIAQAVQVH